MSDTKATLAAEAEGRRWAIPTAAAAALLPVVGAILYSVLFGRGYENQPAQLLRLNEQGTGLVLSAVIGAIGTALLAFPLLYLQRAIAARRPSFSRGLRLLGLVGPPLLAVSQVAKQAVVTKGASDYASEGVLTLQRGTDLVDTGLRHAADYIGLVGALSAGAGLMVVSINAMSVGLLPRFVGYVGAFAGILIVLPLLPSPLLLAFWLGAVAMIIAGRYPGQRPPAWETGRAEPWPSLAEQRERAQAGAAPEPATEPAAPPKPAHPGAARRKRKQRR